MLATLPRRWTTTSTSWALARNGTGATTPTFGCVTRGKVDIFFCEGAQGPPGMWMSICVDDVDALHEEYKSSGAVIRQPPTNIPWSVREMNVRDPDGHRFRSM